MTIPQVTVKEAGYIFVYLSYEDQSNNYVYFDDFKVTLTPTNVIQTNEYYAFGLQTANSWTRDTATGNNFLGNGGTELNTTSQLYDLEYRSFDAALGRLHQIDPMADKFSSLSPYHFAYNNPTGFVDANGAAPWSADFESSYVGSDYGQRRLGALVRGHGGNELSEAGWNAIDIYGDGYSPQAGWGSYADLWEGGRTNYNSMTDGELVWRTKYRDDKTAETQYYDRNAWIQMSGETWRGFATHVHKTIVASLQGRAMAQAKIDAVSLKNVSTVNILSQDDSPYPPTDDMIARFSQSISEKFFERMAESFSSRANVLSLENYIQIAGEGANLIDDNKLIKYPPIDDRPNPWSYPFSVYLVGYSFSIENSDGKIANSVYNPSFNGRRSENIEYEIGGFGAPYFNFRFTSGTNQVNVYIIFHTHDPFK